MEKTLEQLEKEVIEAYQNYAKLESELNTFKISQNTDAKVAEQLQVSPLN